MLAAEFLDVLFDVVDARELESPLDATGDGARLVVGEVDTVFLLEHPVDGAHPMAGFARFHGPNSGTAHVLDEHAGHVLGWQDIVRHARFTSRLRHAVELSALDVLDHHQAARLVHGADAARPITAATREHDRYRARGAVLRQ